jgi:UDP-2,4-diacetamido-2,4,6-trideoxy-beta-L-altropyranose hydrolase
MRVAVRSDASSRIGTGHVMRSLTLARALSRRGAEVTFLTRAYPDGGVERARAAGFPVVPLAAGDRPGWLGVDAEDERQEAFAALARLGRLDAIVVDHYGLDLAWERRARAFAGTIAVIDDLADRAHDCDVLLDATFPAAAERYAGLVPSHAALLLGPQYALLRDEFLEAAARRRPRDGTIGRVLVFFGGGEAAAITALALDALDRVAPQLAVDVVAGTADAAVLAPAIERRRNATLLVAASMAELMERADLALGAGGTTSWERCALGLPAVVVSRAANQRAVNAGLSGAGAVLDLGDARDVDTGRLAAAIGALLAAPDRVRAMVAASREVGDGRGADRAAEAIVASSASAVSR